jgi:hypothetical protein
MHSADEITSITCLFNLYQSKQMSRAPLSAKSCMKGKTLSVKVQAWVFNNGYKYSHQQQYWDLKAE